MRLTSGARLLASAAIAASCAGSAAAQLASSAVSGRVVEAAGRAVGGARVELLDALGRAIHQTTADGEGRFHFAAVMPGTYWLRASGSLLRSPMQPVVVSDGLPVLVTVTVSPQLAESVSVTDQGTSGAASETTLAGEAIQQTPAALQARAVRLAVSGTAGWTSEDNGLMHYRGSDDGILFVLDGIPVYERLDPQFGAGLDPLLIGSVRVLSGYVAPEYGLRAGGVVEVRSQRAATDSWAGAVEAGAGSERAAGASGAFHGPLGAAAGLTIAIGAERSDRFLDPVTLDNRHNEGSTFRGSGELLWTPGADTVSLRAGGGASSFEVPQTAEQTGDPAQQLRDAFATASWQRAWSGRTVSRLAVVARTGDGRLLGDPGDAPLFAESDRGHRRIGMLAGLARERGRHRLKAGTEWSSIRLDEQFRFAVTDRERGEEAGLSEEVLAHDTANPFDFAAGVRRPVVSFYLQDSWRASTRLAIEAGVRYDHARLLLSESQWSPRLGAAYRLGRATVRTSVNRLFQPPQTEFLLLSSSPQAHALSPFRGELGEGGADVRAERQTAVEAGCELSLGRARVDLAVWRRWVRNQGDPNLFLGTSIIFPNSVAEGMARGLDVRLELPRSRGFTGFMTYTLARVEQVGPINGGLFLEDDMLEIGPGTRFTPDHDQRHAVTAQLAYGDARRSWFSLSARYRSGTPLEVDDEDLDAIAAREGSELVDLESGRVRPYLVLDAEAGRRLLRRSGLELSARAVLLNLTGARYAFNFANPFSGTHFGAPRTARLDFRLAFE
jgi:hypothetical protein